MQSGVLGFMCKSLDSLLVTKFFNKNCKERNIQQYGIHFIADTK